MAARNDKTKLLGKAFAGPLNLGVLGSAVIGAVALASWPIAAIGGAAYAALVATDLTNPKFRTRVLRGVEAPKLDPSSVRDDVVRAAALEIAQAKVEVMRVVDALPQRVRRNVAQALAAIAELEAHAGVLVARADELATYLTTVDVKAIKVEALGHSTKAQLASDDAEKADYQAAADAGQERVRAIQDLDKARQRTLAHLAKIAATIKTVPSKLVKLRALDDQARGALSSDVGSELERMNVDLRAFEQTLESIVEVTT
jgi:hypothetical protein